MHRRGPSASRTEATNRGHQHRCAGGRVGSPGGAPDGRRSPRGTPARPAHPRTPDDPSNASPRQASGTEGGEGPDPHHGRSAADRTKDSMGDTWPHRGTQCTPVSRTNDGPVPRRRTLRGSDSTECVESVDYRDDRVPDRRAYWFPCAPQPMTARRPPGGPQGRVEDEERIGEQEALLVPTVPLLLDQGGVDSAGGPHRDRRANANLTGPAP